MSQFRLATAFLLALGVALPAIAEAQTPPASGQQAQRQRLLGPRQPPASHRAPQHHRRSHGVSTHGIPSHRTVGGPRG